MTRAMTALLLLGLAVPPACLAELRAVRLSIDGMDCAACPYVMRVAIAELEGVDSVAVSRNQRALEIRLLPGNEITIGRIHRIALDRGFRPERTDLQVVGTVVSHEGRPAVHLESTNVTVLVEDEPSSGGLAERLEREAKGKRVVAEGQIRGLSRGKPSARGVNGPYKLLLREFALVPGD